MPEGMPTQIGRYNIVSELGRGGFGCVYRAFDPSVGRDVALKVLTAGGGDVLTRFRNEAKVAGNLRHENIVTVYESGEHEGKPFLAMEYLEGEDLHHCIATHRPFSLLQKCNIMSQVAEGLYCAHRNGVVHRDVKPANIMVLGDGTVKIMDFGIARITNNPESIRLTQDGYMIGTILYMAPEQFSGVEVDTLCDIFACGLIYYELLTGKHPFQAQDSRSVVYNMTYEDPRPIRDFVPDCPEALQHVVLKMLRKDRDLRYQSLKEVQFDTGPIRMELQQDRAAALLLQAQDLFERRQFDPAQALVLEVLSLDASNRIARSLWESLQKQLQHRTLQPRIESQLSAGEKHLAEREFPQAVRTFETARRLDPDNPYIQGRLDHARGLLEHSRQAAQLLDDARKEFEQQNLTGAHRSAAEALRHDPQNQEAAQLMSAIQSAVESARREQRVQDAIEKSEGLLLLHSYDDAIRVLTGLGADATSEKVVRTLARILSEKEARLRREKLQRELAEAAGLLRKRELAESIARLEALRREYPEHEEVAKLLSFAQKEVQAAERAKAVDCAAKETAALMEEKNYQAAVSNVEDALRRYPGEPALIELLAAVTAAKSGSERQQAIVRALDECSKLREQRQFAPAIAKAEAALRDFGPDPSLTDLLKQLEDERSRHRASEMIGKTVAHARKLLDQKQPERAVQLIQQELVLHPGERALGDLLEQCRGEVRVQEKLRAVAAILRDASMHSHAGDFDRALRTLEQGLKAWPDEVELVHLRQEVAEAKQARDTLRAQAERDAARTREQEAQDALKKLSLLERSGEIDAALRAAEELLRQAPHNPQLVDAAARLRERQRRDRLARDVDAIHAAVTQQDFLSATRLLDAATLSFPGESVLSELDCRLASQKHLAEVELRLADGDPEAADALLRQRPEWPPDDARAAACSQAIAAGRARGKREESIRQARLETEFVTGTVSHLTDLQTERQRDSALREAETALARYPENPELAEALAHIRETARQEQHRAGIARLVQEVEKSLASGEWSDASSKLAAARQAYPNQRVFDQLGGALQEQERQQQIDRFAAAVEDAFLHGDLPEAERLIDAHRQQFSSEDSWKDLNAALGRRKAYEQALGEAGILHTAKEYERAEAVLRDAIGKGAPDRRAALLLQTVTADRRASELREEIATASAEANRLTEEGNFAEALGMLDRICRKCPDDADLMQQRRMAEARLEQEKQDIRRRESERRLATDRARAIEAFRSTIEEAIAARNWSEALAAIGTARREVGEEGLFSELSDRVAAERRREELERLQSAVHKCFADRDLEEAARHIAAAGPDHSGQPVWTDLRDELARRRAYAAQLTAAEDCYARGDRQQARELLVAAASGNPPDDRAARLLEDVSAGRPVKRTRKPRRLLWMAAAAASLGVAFAIYFGGVASPPVKGPANPKAPPLLKLTATPAELSFTHTVGDPEPPEQIIDWNGSGIGFRASARSGWIHVTPDNGGSLDRLRVVVSAGSLTPDSYSGFIDIQPQAGRTADASVSIPVRLTVIGPVVANAIKDVLQLDRDALRFDYVQNGPQPAQQPVNARSAIAKVEVLRPDLNPWLRAKQLASKVVLFDVTTVGVAPGSHQGTVLVYAAGPGGSVAKVSVTLNVQPAPVLKVDPPKTDPPKTDPAPPAPSAPSAGSPPPQGTGCDESYGERNTGYFLWSGQLAPLAPGETVTLNDGEQGGVSKGRLAFKSTRFYFPPKTSLDITAIEPGTVAAERVPEKNNRCAGILLRNRGTDAVSSITVHWRVRR